MREEQPAGEAEPAFAHRAHRESPLVGGEERALLVLPGPEAVDLLGNQPCLAVPDAGELSSGTFFVEQCRHARLRLLWVLLTGRLARSPLYEERSVRRLTVRSLNGPMRIACDGETFDAPAEMVVEKLARPLDVYVPERRA